MPKHNIRVSRGEHPAKRKKGKEGLMRESVFMVLLNTNRRYASPNDPDFLDERERLGGLVEFMFGKDYINRLLVHPYTRDPIPEHKVKEVDVNGVIEVGDEHNLLHAHIRVAVRHTSMVHLDVDFMRSWAGRVLKFNDGKSPLVRVSGSPSVRDMDAYIHKTVKSKRVEQVLNYSK